VIVQRDIPVVQISAVTNDRSAGLIVRGNGCPGGADLGRKRGTLRERRSHQQWRRQLAGDAAAGRFLHWSGRAGYRGPLALELTLRLAAVGASAHRTGVKVMDGGDDTLTESCEGAVSFMVIEIRVGSLQELPVVVL
jgi:hypothetical protein